MPVTIMPATMKHRDGNSFVTADCIKGDPGAPGSPGDPTLLIDDTQKAANKTYSSNKIDTELGKKITEPQSDGTNGQVLTTDGNGGRSWTNKPSVPVTDVQVNGTTVLSQGVANVPIAASNVLGVMKPGDGLQIDNNGTVSVTGKISAPESPATGAFLVYNGSAWVAQTLSVWQGGSY